MSGQWFWPPWAVGEPRVFQKTSSAGPGNMTVWRLKKSSYFLPSAVGNTGRLSALCQLYRRTFATCCSWQPIIRDDGSHCVSPWQKSQTVVWDRTLRPNWYAKRLKSRFRPIVPSLWQTQKIIKNLQRSVRVGYYTALSYDVIRDVFVLFTCAKVSWFETLVLGKDEVSNPVITWQLAGQVGVAC